MGLRYGQNFPELRSKVASEKSDWNKLVLAVTFRPCILKMAITFFLVRSISGPDAFLIMARSSSRYNLISSMWIMLDSLLK